MPALKAALIMWPVLDMIHLVSDEEANLALRRIHEKLEAGGTLLVRATVPSERKIRPNAGWKLLGSNLRACRNASARARI